MWRSLSNKLPFEDDSFDHVHVVGIARGVPENKVRNTLLLCEEQRLILDLTVELTIPGSSFADHCLPSIHSIHQEVHRVLEPGGFVEVIEDGDCYLYSVRTS